MSHQVTYNAELNIIEASFLGEVRLEDIRDSFSAILPIAREKNCFRFLFDFREATIRVSIVEMFGFPKALSAISAEFNLNPGTFKRAVILPNNFSEYRFAENLAVNYGQHTGFFREAEEAKKWLLEN